MNTALSTILHQPVYCIGCGRTDSGVHASQFFLHFDAVQDLPENFIHRMNSYLPHDIAVHRCIPVHDTAHSRFDATQRTYEYLITERKDVYRYGMVFYKPFYRLDIPLMQEAAQQLLQYNDFPSFCKSKAGSKTTLVKLTEANWFYRDHDLVFRISADRFLRGMVRLVVGAMFQVGEHRMSLETLDAGIRNKQRFPLAMSAPAHALYLSRVQYPYISQ